VLPCERGGDDQLCQTREVPMMPALAVSCQKFDGPYQPSRLVMCLSRRPAPWLAVPGHLGQVAHYVKLNGQKRVVRAASQRVAPQVLQRRRCIAQVRQALK